MKRREQSQTEQLRRALGEREAQLQEAQARLAALEASTSLQVGRALTSAAKRPGRGLVRLPRDLFRLWRRSGRTTQATGRRKPDPVRSYETEREEARLLSGAPGAPDGRLSVAGVLSAEAAEALRPYVRVVPLLPHDAQPVFESVDVDAVLVTASAAAPGAAGPWAHTGDPAAADRTRALAWVLEAAAARGVPTVLLDDAPAPPALARLGFDLVHDGGAGVPLHRFNPIAADPERSAEPVRLAASRPSGAAARRLLGALGDDGPRTAEASWEDLPDLLRSSASVVVEDSAAADRALACGARALLVGRGGDAQDRAAAVPPGAADPAAVLQELERVRRAGPLSPEEVRAVLRSVFLTDAVPVRLAEVFGRVDFAPGSAGASAVLAGRRAAVLAAPADDTEALALADDLLNQDLAPAEAVVPAEAAHLAGVERLRSFGVPVRTAPVPSGGPGHLRWAALARAASAPWSVLWREPRGAGLLADLLCAAECSGADAVGAATVPGGGDGAWEAATADQDYVFVGGIRPDLARTELAGRGIDPGLWNRHGARLLALGPGLAAGEAAEAGLAGGAPGAS
ncbi:hypothetical protein [Nocardiopsis chromatogenes]|uniref:hypothetical protein n=1 Tax=Nocardiopsis chromatogenes TaxID=280239 RepID=UPI00034B14CD|nr:hypothetical protein [Nocardiopsis chromatogenes]